MTTLREVRATLIKKNTKERFVAFLGTSQRIVKVEGSDRLYARKLDGTVIQIANSGVPPIPDLRVIVSNDQGQLTARPAEVYTPSHASHHEFGGADAINKSNKSQKCSWCGQYTEAQEPCRYCGAPN